MGAKEIKMQTISKSLDGNDNKQIEGATVQEFSSMSASAVVNEGNNWGTIIVQGNVQAIGTQNIIERAPPKNALPSIWGLPAENLQFFNRKLATEISEKMANRQGKSSNQLILVAMSGLGGVGKTELAKYYVYHNQKNYTARLWFNANTCERLEAEYRSLAQELNFYIDEKTSNEDIKKKLHTFLADHPGWLIVVDNADDMEKIQPLLPSQGGDILITSRQRDWPGEIIKIGVLEAVEAIAFYKKLSSREDNEESIKALVEELGYLPLAIAQAAAYVKRSPHVNAKEYLKLFNQHKAEILRTNKLLTATEEEKVRLTIATTWNLSLKAIEQKYKLNDEARVYARTLLTACAYLDAWNIPYPLLQQYLEAVYPDKPSKIILNEAIDKLNEYSLIEVDREFVQVHKLVQKVVKEEMLERKDSSVLSQLSNILIDDSQQKNLAMTDIYRRQKLVPHLLAISTVIDDYLGKELEAKDLLERLKARLLGNVGLIYFLVGNARAAKEPLERALAIKERHYGPEHVEVAKTLVSLANALGALGDTRQRKALLEKALAIEEKHYGPEHVEVAKTLVSLANALGALGDTRQAKAMLEKALAIEEKHYGPEHVEVANTLVNLATALGDLGNTRQAKAMLEKALAIQEKHYGPEYVDVAITLVNLATALGALGDTRQPKVLLERALAIQEKHYGPEHVDVANTLVNLATALDALGDTRQPKVLLERALAIQQKHYGPEHVDVANTLVNLATALDALGDTRQAKAMLEKALAIQQKHYGSEHVDVAKTLGNLASAVGALGDNRQAKAMLERALAIEEKHYGPEHVGVAKTLVNLAIALGALGDNRQAKAMLERALAIEEKHYGSGHVKVARTLGNLANALGDLGDTRQAKALLERALAIEEKHYGKAHPETALTLYNLGIAHASEDNLTKAKTIVERALAMVVNYPGYGENHPRAQHIKKGLAFINQELKLSSQSQSQPPSLTLDDVIKKYNLPNSEQISLEKGLRSAVANQSIEEVKVLLKYVKKINAQDTSSNSQKTALHWAIIKNNLDCVKLLLDKGANWQIKEAQGLNSVRLAKQKGHEQMVAFFRNYLVVKYKLTNDSQTSLEKGLRDTVIKEEKEDFILDDISLFIELVENINAKDTHPEVGKTALHHAVIKNKVNCVKRLLEAGANPEIADAKGNTAIDYARESSHEEIQSMATHNEEDSSPLTCYDGDGQSSMCTEQRQQNSHDEISSNVHEKTKIGRKLLSMEDAELSDALDTPHQFLPLDEEATAKLLSTSSALSKYESPFWLLSLKSVYDMIPVLWPANGHVFKPRHVHKTRLPLSSFNELAPNKKSIAYGNPSCFKELETKLNNAIPITYDLVPDTHPSIHSVTGAPIFRYFAYEGKDERGHIDFYQHPLLCVSSDRTRHNVFSATGIFAEVVKQIIPEHVLETCEAVPPTAWEEIMLIASRSGIEGAKYGVMRGISRVVTTQSIENGYSVDMAQVLGKIFFYVCFYFYQVSQQLAGSNRGVDGMVLLRAAIITGQMAVMELMVTGLVGFCRQSSDYLAKQGSTRGSAFVTRAGQTVTAGLYGYQMYQQGALAMAAGTAAGVAAEQGVVHIVGAAKRVGQFRNGR